MWEGATKIKTVVRALLADLVSRGLDTTDGLLVILDGTKALSAAVREVFGPNAAIQRCTLRKRRNVAEHLPGKEKDWVDAKLVRAFGRRSVSPSSRWAAARPSEPGGGCYAYFFLAW